LNRWWKECAMSQAEAAWVLGITIFLPFPFAPLAALSGNTARSRRLVAILYGALTLGFNLALLSAFLTAKGQVSVGSISLNRFNYPPFLVLNLVAVAGMFYAGFRRASLPRRALVAATLPVATGLAALAFLAKGLVAFALLWEGVTAVVLIGLILHGAGGVRKRLRGFLPWLLSDALFILGVALCAIWLDERAVFIRPPLTSGSEAQVSIVVALFLASAFIRLGVFPFHFWVRDLLRRTDPAWSALVLGAVNYLMVGLRVLVVASLLGSLVASDWSTAIVAFGLVSVLAGPLLALFARDVPGYLSGMYAFQGGILVMGAGLFSRAGLEGAMFSLLVAPIFMMSAIMASGTADDLRGSSDLNRRGLSVGLAPAAFVVLLLSGMSLCGLPPLDGFVGKTIVAMGALDKAVARPDYAFASFLILAGIALASVAFVRLLGGVFTVGKGAAGVDHPAHGESLAPVALCGASLLLGVFPGLLLSNFIQDGSLVLFKKGFTGPGVVFKGTGSAAAQAIHSYVSWSQPVAAFIFAVCLLALCLYFAGRSVHPFSGPGDRALPFVGGRPGEYRPAPVIEIPLRDAFARWRGVGR